MSPVARHVRLSGGEISGTDVELKILQKRRLRERLNRHAQSLGISKDAQILA
jgi:hypothetical protein